MRRGWAPPRKRPKRLAKKLERNARRQWGWRTNVIKFSPEAQAKFVELLLEADPAALGLPENSET